MDDTDNLDDCPDIKLEVPINTLQKLDHVDLENAEIYGNMDVEDHFVEGPEIGIEAIIQNKVSKNIRDLNGFLSSNNFTTEKGNQTTNLINRLGGTYYLPTNYCEAFFTIMDACRREKRMLHYLERQETSDLSHSGIMIDFDRYQKSSNREFTDRHFESLTTRISKLLNEFIDFREYADGDKYQFRVFYIRKPSVVMEPAKVQGMPPVYKDGFHILIPEVGIIKGLKKFLLDEMVSRGVVKGVFRDIPHMEDPEKMLDKMSASGPVHFLGNSKPSKPAYDLTHAFEVSVYLDEDEIDRKTLNVKDLLAGKTPNTNTPMNITYEMSLGFYIEQFSGNPTWLKKKPLNYRLHLETKIQLLVEKNAGMIIDEDDILACDNSVDILTIGNAEAKHLKNLLSIMDSSYATEYEKWFKVMCAIAHTSSNYKPLAIWFSQRVPDKWSMVEVDRVWLEATTGRYTKNPITKRSIIHWAKESSPQRYKEMEKENYVEVLAKYVYQHEGRIEHSMAGKVVHSMIGDKFAVDVGHNENNGRHGYCWFEFVTPGQSMKKGEIFKWRKELEPDNIHLFIAEHLPKVYMEQAQRIRDRKDNAVNEAETKFWANVEKTFRTYMSKLGNDQFQNGVIRQSQYKFRQRGFFDELDSYEDMIGVGNGVLKSGLETKLIRGFHEYKISKFTEIDYVPYNQNNTYQQTLLKWAADIFPEPDVFLYMWCHASTGLTSYEAAAILTLLVGGGQNGKSSWLKFIHNTLGNQYCASGKASLLVSQFERGESANSAQMQMRGKNWFYIDEFNKCSLLNTARVKSICNPGWQSGRDLHEKQSNFKNTCDAIAASNFDFIIDTTDHGTWRRIYYYKNKVKFCKNPNPDNQWEKLANDNFITKYPNDPVYLQAMMSLLTHFNQILHRDYGGDLKNIPVPTIVRETEEFRNRQDTMNRFITQMIVVSPEAECISVATLATKYVEWYGKNMHQLNDNIMDIQSQFENSRLAPSLEYRKTGTKVLIGHRIKERPEDDLMEDETEIINLIVRREEENIEKDPNIVMPGDLDHVHTEDTFIKDLMRNAPKHIQKRVEVPNVDLNGLLDEL